MKQVNHISDLNHQSPTKVRGPEAVKSWECLSRLWSYEFCHPLVVALLKEKVIDPDSVATQVQQRRMQRETSEMNYFYPS